MQRMLVSTFTSLFLLPSLLSSIVQSFESIVTAYAQEELNITIYRTDNVLFSAELVSWDWFPPPTPSNVI